MESGRSTEKRSQEGWVAANPADTLRHTFASQLVARGVPMTAVQMLMGHSTITTTMRYSHLAPTTLRSAIDMLNPKTALNADFGQPVGNAWWEAQKKELSQKSQWQKQPYYQS